MYFILTSFVFIFLKKIKFQQMKKESLFQVLRKFVIVLLPEGANTEIKALRIDSDDELYPLIEAFFEKTNESLSRDFFFKEKGSSHFQLTDYLFVWHNNGFVKINCDDILWVNASRSYSEIYLANSQIILLSVPLLEVGRYLPKKNFIRINRSDIINLKYVDSFVGNSLYIGKKSFIIGKEYRKEVFGSFLFVGVRSKKVRNE